MLHFIDNEPVRESLVCGNTRAEASLSMLARVACLTSSKRVKFWHARIPSQSNPADACSRLDFEFYKRWQRSVRVEPDLEPLLAQEGRQNQVPRGGRNRRRGKRPGQLR